MRKLSPRCVAIAAVIALYSFLAVPSWGESRTWTSGDGRTLTGEIVSLDGETVKLKTAGGVFELPLTRLSETDQAFARDWKKTNATPQGVPAGSPSEPADRTVGDFSNLKLGEWPNAVSADFEIAAIEVVKEDEAAGEYIYRSPHFEFQTPDRLSTSVVREFARIFEATFSLLNEIPFGLAPRPVSADDEEKGYYTTKLYATKEDYYSDGGMQGSGGMFSWSRRGDTWKGIIKIPMQNLGVEHTGVRYIVDHDKQSTTLVHEITHQVMMRWLPMMPTWMSEGFAEITSCQTYNNGRFRLTSLERAVREDVTRRSGSDRDFQMIEVEKLMKITSQEWSDALGVGQGSRNYASANLLLTYFARLDGEGDGAGLVEYLKAVSSGTESDKAAEEHLLRGRSYEELQENVGKSWRSEGLQLTFQ